jgi:hypothetical protein
MPTGCMNPNAVNYNNAATVEDYSCVYLIRDNNNNCQLFRDVLPDAIEDQSFTMSFSMLGNSWVFFHDYQPDMYIHTHQYLYNLKDGAVYKHHQGPPGVFYSTNPNSFFIDIVFVTEVRRRLGMVGSDYFRESGDMLLEAVEWVTEVLNDDTDQPNQTLTHLSIWNSKQHSGRIPLAQVFTEIQYPNMRRTQGNWSMNNFRDLLQANGNSFLLDIFNNFMLDPNALPPNPLPWYLKKMIQDQWFCVRFEFDNTSGDTILLHDTIIQAIKTNR